jgi:hypothetical protein
MSDIMVYEAIEADKLPKKRSCLYNRKYSSDCNSQTHAGMYKIWRAIRNRCYNPNQKGYKNYGGRGIYMSADWLSFERFVKDMGPRPLGASIERIDNNGPYRAGNCYWCSSPRQQSLNRRCTIWVSYDGETRALPDWADRLGISRQALYRRIVVKKMTMAEALSTEEAFD